MSIVRKDLIWQPEKVLPYLFDLLIAKIETITPVRAIYLFGSRARVPISEWHTLEGKDWDLYIVCDFPIVNTSIWGRDMGYYLDLPIVTQERMDALLKGNAQLKQLYPEDVLRLREKFIKQK